MQCLNIKNKEVAALLDEYTKLLGSYDAAYYVISENNGYGLDTAPNGEPSKLFSDLLTHYNGDRVATIHAKAKVYSESFKNWFGDWTSEDKTNVSKVVDDNGEPLMVYHGSPEGKNIDAFDNNISYNSFFFTSNKDLGKLYSFGKGFAAQTNNTDDSSVLGVFLNIRNPKKVNGKHSNWSNLYVAETKIEQAIDVIIGKYGDVSEHFEEVKDIIIKYLKEEKPNLDDFTAEVKAKKVFNKYIKNKISTDTNSIVRNTPEENDGVIIEDVLDLPYTVDNENNYYGTDIVVKDPNQVKSVDNRGTFSTQEDNIYYQRTTTKEQRLLNFWNNYVKLRSRSIKPAEDEEEHRKRMRRLSGSSKLYHYDPDKIFREILGIDPRDLGLSEFNFDDAWIDKLDSITEEEYLNALTNKIDELKKSNIPAESLISSLYNIKKGYHNITDYPEEVQKIFAHIPEYVEATELPRRSKAKTLAQYNAYQKHKYNEELKALARGLKIRRLRLSSRIYHLETIKMFLSEYENAFRDLKLKVIDEYLYRSDYNAIESPKLQGFYDTLKTLAREQNELNAANNKAQIENIKLVKNVKEALDLLAEKAPEYAKIISYLKKTNLYDEAIVTVVDNFKDGQTDSLGEIVGETHTAVDLGNKEYLVAVEIGSNSFDYETLMHELIHVFTTFGLNGYYEEIGSNEFVNDINNIIKHCNKYYRVQSKFFNATVFPDELNYGFTSPKEFVAEFFSNPAFQMLLKETPAISEEEVKKKNMFQAVIEAITKFFARLISGDNKYANLYDQIEPLMYKIIDIQAEVISNMGLKVKPYFYSDTSSDKWKNEFEDLLNKLDDLTPSEDDYSLPQMDDTVEPSNPTASSGITLDDLHKPLVDDTHNQPISNVDVRETPKAGVRRNKELADLLSKMYPYIEIGVLDDPNLRGEAVIQGRHAGKVLLNALLENEDTLPHEYAHHYISWFIKAPIVQKGIQKFGSEEALVQAIGENSVKALKWYNRFFNWIKGLFNSKQRVLNKLTKSFLSNDLLSLLINNESSIQYQQVSIPEKIAKQRQETLQALKNKLNVLTHSKNRRPKEIESINRLLTQFEKLDDVHSVLTFVNYMSEDVQDSFNTLKNYIEQYKEFEEGKVAINPITPDKLDIIRKGTIGFYNNLVVNLQNMLEDPEVRHYLHRLNVEPDKMPSIEELLNTNWLDPANSIDTYDSTFNTLRTAANQYHELVRYFNLLSDKIAKRNIIEEASKRGSFSVDELKRKLDEGDDDLGWWDRYVGQTQYNSSEVIRLMLDKMVTAKYRVHDKKFEVGKRLLDKLSRVSKSDLKLLYERDKDGKRTGNFIRSLNYGQHERDYIEHMTKFLDTLNVTVPADITFSDIPSILNSDQLKKWNTEKNKWDSIHSERRFTNDFYELMNSLSEDARAKKESLDIEIKLILGSTIDKDGNYHREDLSEEDYIKLCGLESEKRNLSNLFYYDGTQKAGRDREIALEFQEYNKKLRENIKYKSNEEAFNKARAKAKQELTPEKFAIWEQRNTLDKISEQFYEDLKKLSSGKEKSSDQISYEEARSQLIKLYTVNGKVDVANMPDNVRRLITDLDEMIMDEAARTKSRRKSRIMEIAKWEIDPNFKKERGRSRTLSEQHEWEARNGYYTADGEFVPASFWRRLVPKDELRSKYIEKVPNSSWMEVDKNSTFYNKNFDETQGVARVPKKSLYDNSANYNKIKGSLKELYDDLRSVMADANTHIPFLVNKNDGRLPQIEGGSMTQILSQDNVLKGLGYAFKDTFTIKDDDTEYNVDKAVNPDGTKVKLVPTRFLKKLTNPEALTNDIVGSIIAYYGMAINYEEMSKIAPEMDMISDYLSRQKFKNQKGGTIPGMTSKTYDKAVEMVEQFVYGMTENPMIQDFKIGKKTISFSVAKAIKNIAKFTRLNGMGNNLHVILTGLFTNKIQSRLDAMSGIYYDNKALMSADIEITWSYKNALANLGNPNNKNKALCALEWSDTVRSAEQTFSKLNQSRVLRALNQHFWYGGYEIADYITKGKMAIAIMMNYKLDPETGKFVNKMQYLAKHKDKKEANIKWNLLTTTFYDAHTVVGNQFVVKPEYAKNIDETTSNRIRNTIKQVGTRIDTQFTDLDMSFVSTNAFCKLIFIYRNFLLINLQTKFITKRHYDYSTGLFQEAQYRGAFNFLSRHLPWSNKNKIEELKELYKNYDELEEFEKRLLKRVTLEIAFSLFGMLLISNLAAAIAGDDDDDWFKNEMALIALRTGLESRSNLLPIETVNMFNSPTAAWGIAKNFGNAIRTIFDNPNEEVRSGAYKGLKRWQRSLIKITPVRAIYEAKDPKSKMSYYDNIVSMF